MKLELKHLACYLPYGLKAKYTPLQNEYFIAKIIAIRDDGGVFLEGDLDTGFTPHWNYDTTPILRPLSDLTKDEYYRLSGCTEKDSFGFWYGKNNGDSNKRDYIYHSGYAGRWFFLCDGYNQFPYKMMTFFFENHYDVFGLIEKGLAIDINSLTKS